MDKPIFHLAFPVKSLEEAKRFYIDTLGCLPGRTKAKWLDVYFFGHQLTIHEIPSQVLTAEQMGVRHFGIVLDWRQWEAFINRLEAVNASFASPPKVSFQDTPREQGKLSLRDPSGHIIEVKTYRNPKAALALPREWAP